MEQTIPSVWTFPTGECFVKAYRRVRPTHVQVRSRRRLFGVWARRVPAGASCTTTRDWRWRRMEEYGLLRQSTRVASELVSHVPARGSVRPSQQAGNDEAARSRGRCRSRSPEPWSLCRRSRASMQLNAYLDPRGNLERRETAAWAREYDRPAVWSVRRGERLLQVIPAVEVRRQSSKHVTPVSDGPWGDTGPTTTRVPVGYGHFGGGGPGLLGTW